MQIRSFLSWPFPRKNSLSIPSELTDLFMTKLPFLDYLYLIRWNWQHLELKHEERKVIKLKELDENINFEKVSELKFKVTGLRQNHQDLGEFRKYLEDRNCGPIFKILFNVG